MKKRNKGPEHRPILLPYKSSLYTWMRFWAGFPVQIFRNRAEIGQICETCTPKFRSANDFLYKPDLYIYCIVMRVSVLVFWAGQSISCS